MRNPDPLSGVPANERFDGASQDRYGDEVDYHKGPAGTFNFMGTTLEEEARNRGWTFGNRPTGPPPRDLMTIGMRGEPGYDDDPVYGPNGEYTHEGGEKPLTGIIDVD
jgi:hypothetical protein